MRAITFQQPGEPEVLELTEVPDPTAGPHDLLIRVGASALNRADTLQRRGMYPPPPGESEILGLELAGVVEQVGEAVHEIQEQSFAPGDRVFGLVGGGGYAERATLDARLASPMPDDWSFAKAAAVTEVFFTADETIFELGQLSRGQSILIHAGASGVGTTGIQMAREVGAEIYVTAGSQEKIDRCLALGASSGINYKEESFSQRIAELTAQRGVDVVLDFIGATYWDDNLASLKPGGRLVLVGLMGGAKVEANLGALLSRRLQVKGSVLRSRPVEEKAIIARRFRERWLPALREGRVQPIIDRSFPLAEAAAAHAYMEANRNVGKIVLDVSSDA